MDTIAAKQALDELAHARDRGLINEWEARFRAAAILDRSGMATVDLVEFLKAKGHTPFEVARVVGQFALDVKAAYIRERGKEPLQRAQVIEGRRRFVWAYVEDDRPLIEAVYEQSLAPLSSLPSAI